MEKWFVRFSLCQEAGETASALWNHIKGSCPSSLSFSGAMNAGGCIWPRQNRSIRDPQNPKFGMELKDLFQSHCLQYRFLPSARLNLIPIRNWVRDLWATQNRESKIWDVTRWISKANIQSHTHFQGQHRWGSSFLQGWIPTPGVHTTAVGMVWGCIGLHHECRSTHYMGRRTTLSHAGCLEKKKKKKKVISRIQAFTWPTRNPPLKRRMELRKSGRSLWVCKIETKICNVPSLKPI